MRIIETADLTPTSIKTETEKLWVYNGLDCCLTAEILDVLLPQLDNQTASTYAFERELQGPALDMALRGVRIDAARKNAVIDEFLEQIDILEDSLARIAIDGLGLFGFNWRSNNNLKELFYDRLKIPVIKKHGQPTVNREALERMEAYFIARPIIAHLILLRELGKKVGVLRTEIDPDGRMRTSYNIAGTTTGRFSSSFTAFGTGCVRPTAEALTRDGWKQIQYIGDDEEIAQWDRGEISFVRCNIHHEKFEGKLWKYKTEQTSLAVTPGHRVLHWTYYDKKPRVAAADIVQQNHQTYIPLGGEIHGNKTYPAFLPMLMADFHNDGYSWRGSFKKQRKIDRILETAERYNLQIDEQSELREGYHKFSIKNLCDLPKKWGSWILDLTQECAKDLIEEARYWDAHDRGSGYIFFTSDEEQAGWFATLAHMAGKSATIRQVEQSEKSWSDTTMWWVNVKDRDFAQVMRKHWHEVEYTGDVYCPQVPSSFWLVREEGCISVTGNTNLQNIEEALRSIFIADPGMKMAYLDAAQGESRVVGAIEWNLFKDGRYLDACESGDLHTNVAKLCWPDLGWTGDAKSDRQLAERPFYRHYDYRFMCKKIGHGTNYGGKPYTLSKQAKIEQRAIEDFQPKYFIAFPAHQRWHGWVRQQLQSTGVLTTLTGRRRYFFGRRDEDETFRQAVAYDPQGSLGDILNRGMLNVFRANDCQLLMQIHDAILVQYPEAREDEVIPKVQSQLRQQIELRHGRDLIMPFDVKVGWNWGNYDATTNEAGLKSYYPGQDKRKRPTPVHLLDR